MEYDPIVILWEDIEASLDACYNRRPTKITTHTKTETPSNGWEWVNGRKVVNKCNSKTKQKIEQHELASIESTASEFLTAHTRPVQCSCDRYACCARFLPKSLDTNSSDHWKVRSEYMLLCIFFVGPCEATRRRRWLTFTVTLLFPPTMGKCWTPAETWAVCAMLCLESCAERQVAFWRWEMGEKKKHKKLSAPQLSSA